MGTISPLQSPVNPAPKHTIAQVISFVEAQSKKADMGEASARLRITALNSLSEMVAEDEPRNNAEWILDNINHLRERWARVNQSSSAETAKSYASRAKTSIQEYLKWSDAPDKYRFDPKTGPKPGDKKTEKRPKPAAPIVPVVVPIVHGSAMMPPEAPRMGDTRNFPLGEGRGAILFALPGTGVTFADVRKFAVHLFTLATDFNIADADQARVFAMVVRGDTQ